MAQTHSEHDVADPAALVDTARALERAAEIAVDVETNGMHAYRARLCFVQLATEADIYVVDTLAPGVEARALQSSLGDPARRKVFHDAQGDLRVLVREGLAVRGLFDTQRAATLLGLPRLGLGDLVQERFQVKLAKEHQTADFGARPVSPELRSYVADDVRYLLPLAAQLEAEARTAGILEELELDFERLCAEALEPESPPRVKVPGRDTLATAIGTEADRLRHREAAARDVPIGRVLSNAGIAEIATKRPTTLAALAKLPNVKGSFVRGVGEEMLATIARLTAQAAAGELPATDPGPPRDPRRRDREAALKAWRSEAAKQRGVTPSVVLPTYLVERLATSPPADEAELAALPWMGAKRLGLYGPALLELLRRG
jgi:ribonuclease D